MVWLFTLLACTSSPEGGEEPDPPRFVPNPTEDDEAPTPSCTSFDELAEGSFLWPDSEGVTSHRPACSSVSHATGGAAGSEIELTVDGYDGGVAVVLWDWNGDAVAQHRGEGTVRFEMPWSGEVRLTVTPTNPVDPGGPYGLHAACVADCRPFTRSPILLMHGMGVVGDETQHGLPAYEQTLADLGYQVRDPLVDPYNPTPIRAAAWRAHLDAWRAEGTWRTVHLYGHSMGGLDARYLVDRLDPDAQVISVTTLASPHHGSPVADEVLWLVQESSWADATVEVLLDILVPDHDGTQDVEGVMDQLSVAGMEAFNQEVFDRPDVAYRSWSGKTCNLLAWDCQEAWDGEVAGADMAVTISVLELRGYEDSDGVVPLDSAPWGVHEGILSADHMELMGANDPDDSFDGPLFIERDAARLAAWERGEMQELEPLATGGRLGR